MMKSIKTLNNIGLSMTAILGWCGDYLTIGLVGWRGGFHELSCKIGDPSMLKLVNVEEVMCMKKKKSEEHGVRGTSRDDNLIRTRWISTRMSEFFLDSYFTQ